MLAGTCWAACRVAYSKWMQALRIYRVFCVFAALSALACTGGQTGEEETTRCREQRTPLAFDEVSALGFPAQDVLALTGEGFTLPLTWQAIPGLSYGPESGTSTITLRIENARDPVYVGSEYRAPAGLDYLACADSLVITADATLSSGGGALDESFKATLTAQSAGAALLLQDFDPNTLSGSLSLEPEAASTRVRRVSLQARWDQDGASGLILAGIEQQSSQTSGFRMSPLACFDAASTRSGCGP